MAAGQTQVQLQFLHMKSKSVSSRLTEYSALMAAAAKINGKDLSSEQEMELRGERQEVEGDAGEEVGDCGDDDDFDDHCESDDDGEDDCGNYDMMIISVK